MKQIETNYLRPEIGLALSRSKAGYPALGVMVGVDAELKKNIRYSDDLLPHLLPQ